MWVKLLPVTLASHMCASHRVHVPVAIDPVQLSAHGLGKEVEDKGFGPLPLTLGLEMATNFSCSHESESAGRRSLLLV